MGHIDKLGLARLNRVLSFKGACPSRIASSCGHFFFVAAASWRKDPLLRGSPTSFFSRKPLQGHQKRGKQRLASTKAERSIRRERARPPKGPQRWAMGRRGDPAEASCGNMDLRLGWARDLGAPPRCSGGRRPWAKEAEGIDRSAAESSRRSRKSGHPARKKTWRSSKVVPGLFPAGGSAAGALDGGRFATPPTSNDLYRESSNRTIIASSGLMDLKVLKLSIRNERDASRRVDALFDKRPPRDGSIPPGRTTGPADKSPRTRLKGGQSRAASARYLLGQAAWDYSGRSVHSSSARLPQLAPSAGLGEERDGVRAIQRPSFS